MAKFCGKIGFIVNEEIPKDSGIWRPVEKTRVYKGDEITNTSFWDTSNNVNDDFSIKNQISIVADSFAYEHIGCMKFIEYLGSRWKISTINVKRPRIILTIGGLYNVKQNESP